MQIPGVEYMKVMVDASSKFPGMSLTVHKFMDDYIGDHGNGDPRVSVR